MTYYLIGINVNVYPLSTFKACGHTPPFYAHSFNSLFVPSFFWSSQQPRLIFKLDFPFLLLHIKQSPLTLLIATEQWSKISHSRLRTSPVPLREVSAVGIFLLDRYFIVEFQSFKNPYTLVTTFQSRTTRGTSTATSTRANGPRPPGSATCARSGTTRSSTNARSATCLGYS